MKTEIKNILERNKRVEADKAWEVSLSRRLLIAFLTYLVILLFFIVADLPNPFINALIPTLGFLLSTLSLNIIKLLWMKYIYKNN